MILLKELTPQVYYNQSRDFQFIGRLYDLVLNSVKTNTDLIYSVPLSTDVDDRLMDLLTMTLGFESKHNYNIQQLKALCSAFAKVIRNKGNIQSIRYACNALLGAEGIDEEIVVNYDAESYTLQLFIPQQLSDINLLRDLLTYILPAGMSCSITKTLISNQTATTEVEYAENVWISRDYDEEGHSKLKTKLTSVIIDTIEENTDDKKDDITVSKNRPRDVAGAFENVTIVDNLKDIINIATEETNTEEANTNGD